MDTLFISPLESSVSRLVEEHLRALLSQFEEFATFTASKLLPGRCCFEVFHAMPFTCVLLQRLLTRNGGK